LVCIIIVTHNNSDTLKNALDSLINSDNEFINEIVIVDNNSTDNTRFIIDEFFYKYRDLIKKIELQQNLGFPWAVNIGFKLCKNKEPYFALFNPDAIATKGWLRELLYFMNENERVGMTQSLLIKPNGGYDSAGGFINGLGYPLEFKPRIDYKTLSKLKPYEIGYAKGAAVLIRTKAFLQIGGFDNRYFFYYDEVDLSYRMRKYGWKIYLVPRSIVIHIGLGSKIPNKELFVLYYMERNHLLFLYKNIRSRFIPALIWSLAGGLHEKCSIRMRIRLQEILDAIKLVMGRQVRDPIQLAIQETCKSFEQNPVAK
jgi:GT2 family glycosyltransferase